MLNLGCCNCKSNGEVTVICSHSQFQFVSEGENQFSFTRPMVHANFPGCASACFDNTRQISYWHHRQ